MAQMLSIAPLFIEDGDFTSTLILVNAASISTYADVSVRSLYGNTVAMKRVELQPHSQKQVKVRTLLDSAHASGITTGSITVIQDPDLTGLVVTAVLSMTRMSSFPSNYINQELAMPTADGSSTLRAVTDAEEGSPIVSITSLSDMPQHVKMRCLTTAGNTFAKTIELSANETLLTDACSNDTLHGADFQRYSQKERSEQHGPVGVELVSDGMPGSFAAFALIPHRSQDHPTFFSSAIFTDPAMVKSSTTVFTGVAVGSVNLLPAGKYVPTLSLANFSGKNSNVTIRYARTVDNEAASQDIEKVVVPAHGTKEISFPHLRGEPNLQNSFLIVADSLPGSIAAKLVSRSDSRLREVEQLGKDLLDPQNGGNHPWSIEDGTESTLLLFNTSNSPQFFDVGITSAGIDWHKAYQLKPMQTKAISINDLVRLQIKDDKGIVLPKDSWNGQVDWYLANFNTGRGRILQSNRENAMALDFSCGVNINLCQLQFSGTLLEIQDGQTVDFGSINPYVCMNSCNGTPAGGGCTGCTYGWDSQTPSIASISGPSSNQSVSVYGASPGTTYIDAFASGMGCYVQVSPSPPAPGVPQISFSSLQGVAQSGSANITVSFSGGATSSPVPITLTLATTTGTGSATFSTGGTTLSISTPGTITVNGVTASSTVNNIKLDAVVSGSQSVANPPLTFSVVSVTLSLQTSGTISSSDPGTSSFLDGSSILGNRLVNGYVPNETFCMTTYQVTGIVTPTNYPGAIYLKRTVSGKGWLDPGGTLLATLSGDDTSQSPLVNYVPSIGKVYDLDAPGSEVGLSDSIGTIRRLRVNFDEYAVLGGASSTTKVSTQDLLFYSRSSCGKISASPGTQFDPTYSGDNQMGSGTTPVSDNLQ